MTADELAAHLREHDLMAEAHRQDHLQLANELRETARALENTTRNAAEQLATSVRTTAEFHWKNHEREHEQADRALDKSEESLTRRLEGMNAFREQLTEQASNFMTRESSDAENRLIEEKIASLEKWMDNQIGKSAGIQPMVSLGFSVLTAVVTAVAVAFALK